MKKQSILITGGAGYIGSILTPILLGRQFKVTVLDSLMYNQQSLLECCVHSDFDFIRGNICDEALISSLVPKFDIIISLAAVVGVRFIATDGD